MVKKQCSILGVTAPPAISFIGPSVYTNANSRDFEIHRGTVRGRGLEWNQTSKMYTNKTVKDLAVAN